MTIFFNFSTASSHLHPLQVENCDSNSRLVVDEVGNGIFRLEKVRKTVLIPFKVSSSLYGMSRGIGFYLWWRTGGLDWFLGGGLYFRYGWYGYPGAGRVPGYVPQHLLGRQPVRCDCHRGGTATVSGYLIIILVVITHLSQTHQ